jgi:hypothetical protein
MCGRVELLSLYNVRCVYRHVTHLITPLIGSNSVPTSVGQFVIQDASDRVDIGLFYHEIYRGVMAGPREVSTSGVRAPTAVAYKLTELKTKTS